MFLHSRVSPHILVLLLFNHQFLFLSPVSLRLNSKANSKILSQNHPNSDQTGWQARSQYARVSDWIDKLELWHMHIALQRQCFELGAK